MIRVDANSIRPYVTRLVGEVPPELIMKVLLSPIIQDGLTGLGMGMTLYPPGSANVPHSHPESQEVWYVVSGKGEMVAGEERLELGPDTVIVAPPGVQHHIINTGNEELKVVWMFTPPGPETQFIA